jgi:hypothetical protein
VSDFAAIITQTVVEGRTLIESLMQESCVITRVDSAVERGGMDPETMQYPAAPLLTIYEGKCRIQIRSAVASALDSSAGDRESTVQERELQLPIDGTDEIAINDIVEITSAALDPSLAGRAFTVVARHEKSHATARRLRIREVAA